MLRIMDYREANTRLRLSFGEPGDPWYVSALSPEDRCIWKSIAKEKGAKLISPFSKSSWKNNRLLVVDPNNGDVPFPYMYIITFEDWDGTIINKIRVASGAIISPIPSDDEMPERQGYIFDHWETSSGSVLNPGVTTATGDVTYIALYISSSYKITWRGNGGTWPGGSSSKISNANYHDSISSIANASPKGIPSKGDGWTFVKWTYEDGSDIGSGDLVEGDVTLKANWELTGPTTYTIIFINEDSEYDRYTNVAPGSIIQKPTPDPEHTPETGKVFTFTGWVINDGTNRKLITDIKYALDNEKDGIGQVGTYTFVAEYDGDDVTDNNIKIFDNIGRMAVSGTTPPKASVTGKSGDIGDFWNGSGSGWYSMVHDGHNYNDSNGDVLSSDRGISPSEAERKRVLESDTMRKTYIPRHKVTLNGTDYYSYVGDSIVYEYFDITQSHTSTPSISEFKTSDSLVTANDLLSEITFRDSNNNIVLHIKSNKSWIKFAIVDVRQQYINGAHLEFADIDKYRKTGSYTDNDVAHLKGIMVLAEINYYIADNTATGNKGRLGIVHVDTPQGGYCTYVTDESKRDTDYYKPTGSHALPKLWPFTSTGGTTLFPYRNDNYMTEGNVYFYQLGMDYTDKIS